MMATDRNTTPDAAAIAKSLGQARKLANGGWSCRCPAHDDKHASLSLDVKDGRLLWKCHAGCTQAAVQDALGKAGLIGRRPQPTGRAFHTVTGGKDQAKAAAGPTPLGRIVATYDYVDVTGTLLFQVVRFEPKTFRQRRPKGAGWEWGIGRVEPVLYRLPEVLAAEQVVVVEGEKDVERLRAIGFAATTSPMGAGKWRPSYGEALSGKHVVVLPDNDDAGRKHAVDVAGSASACGAKSVRVVELPKLAEKGDLSDWLDAGGTREKLMGLIRSAPLWADTVAEGDAGWRARLVQGDYGPHGNEANCGIALAHAPELVGRIRFDAFRTAAQCRDVPWDPGTEWRDWADEDDVSLAIWCQENGINIPPIRVAGVVQTLARRVVYHPIRDYLNGLKWDGEERLDDWLNAYLGVAYQKGGHMDYVKAVGAKWLVSAVARVMEPGCKVDTALILEGEQGMGKSTALATMFGKEWFADQIADLGSKDSAQDIRGKWLIEFAELKNVRGPEVEKVKAFLSRSVDHYRPSFGRRAIDVPRQCVFAGSTNEDVYLHDQSGNRRFWPVKVGRIDLAELARNRDQLWAEAALRYAKGAQWWLTADEDRAAAKEQAVRLEEDPWASFARPWLAGRAEVTTREVLIECLGREKREITRADETRCGQMLRGLGFRAIERRHPTYGSRIYAMLAGNGER